MLGETLRFLNINDIYRKRGSNGKKCCFRRDIIYWICI